MEGLVMSDCCVKLVCNNNSHIRAIGMLLTLHFRKMFSRSSLVFLLTHRADAKSPQVTVHQSNRGFGL